MRPKCHFVHTGKFNEHLSVYADYMAPQSTDQGKNIEWVPVCNDHWESWWDGADWGPILARTITPPSPLAVDNPPTKVRVFFEDDHWAIDGVDDHGNHTETVWDSWNGQPFTSVEQAMERTEAFAAAYVTPGCPVEIQQGPRVDPAYMKEAKDELAAWLEELRQQG